MILLCSELFSIISRFTPVFFPSLPHAWHVPFGKTVLMIPRFFPSIAQRAVFSLLALTAMTQPPTVAKAGVMIAADGPGYYGQINIPTQGEPLRTFYPAPFFLQERLGSQNLQPLFLSLPEYQVEHWHDYCHLYHACWRPVYLSVVDLPSRDGSWHGQRWHHHHDDD